MRAQMRGEIFRQHSEQVRHLRRTTLLNMTTVVRPPETMLPGIGYGDYAAIGASTVEVLRRFAHLRPNDRVLDIGCGLGRVSQPLLRELGPAGTYDGLDTVPEYIDWCRENIPAGRFHLVDLHSSFYNPAGTIRPEEFRFPWMDGAFTLTIATSLFTHLSADAAVNYLREAFRTLAPGGRLFASFFVLDGWARSAIQRGTVPQFQFDIEHGMLADQDNPDFAIAFDAQWLLEQFQSIGFTIAAFERGTWREPDGPMYQDLVIAKRPA
jgi:SAM-dependent methyltransferase